MSKVCFVLEGGSMRGMYTAGILDIFMDHGIETDGIIGVSAGALFAPNYYSKQRGRALRYNRRYARDLRNMSFLSFLFTGNLVNKKFAYYDITLKHDIFDNDTYKKNYKGYYVTVTNIETGEAEYLELKDVIKDMEILRATAAIPVVSKIVTIDGKKYLDGGVADSIPVLKAKQMGYDKIIVILTRHNGYKKEPISSRLLKIVKILYKKYPKFIEVMENRYKVYNETLEMIKELENNNEIFVFRPSKPIKLSTIVRNPDDLLRVYNLGVNDANKQLEKLKEYIRS